MSKKLIWLDRFYNKESEGDSLLEEIDDMNSAVGDNTEDEEEEVEVKGEDTEQEQKEEQKYDERDLELQRLKAKLEMYEDKGKEKQVVEKEEYKDEKVDFIKTDDDFHEVTTTKDGMNRMLNKVYNDGYKKALMSVTDVVNKSIDSKSALDTKARLFWEDNQDLLEHAEYVEYTVNKIIAQKPELGSGNNLDTLFKEVEIASRKALKIDKKEDKGGKPGFIKSKGSKGIPQKGGEELSGIQKEIAEMNKAIEKI